MTGKKDDFGAINVEMGDGNRVGDIGHKITFHAPPPDPNSIWQGGKVVGSISGEPAHGNGTYTFPKLFADAHFDSAAEFQVQGVGLRIENIDGESSASIGGRPPIHTFWRAVCRIL